MTSLGPNVPSLMQSFLALDSLLLADELKPVQVVIHDPFHDFMNVLMRHRWRILLRISMSPREPKQMQLPTKSERHTYASGLRSAICLRNLKAAKPHTTCSF